MHAAAELDIASARARHAQWLHATQPRFLSTEDSSSDGQGCMTIHQARHPLLLGPCLDPLPRAPSTGDQEESVGIGQPVETAKPDTRPKGRQRKLPVPLDLLVPAGKTVVVVTGPNTGGSLPSPPELSMLAPCMGHVEPQ